MTYAYLRVSTIEQDLEKQRYGINKWCELHDVVIDETVEEKITSRSKDRAVFGLVDRLKKGDLLLVSELSRLGRSLKELIFITESLVDDKGVRVVFIKEGIDLDEFNPQGRLQITLLAAIAQYERDLNSMRTKEGIAAKRDDPESNWEPGRKGKPARHYKIDTYADEITDLMEKGTTKAWICRHYNVSRPTLIKALERWSVRGSDKLEPYKGDIMKKIRSGVTKTQIAEQYGVARSTLYATLQKWL